MLFKKQLTKYTDEALMALIGQNNVRAFDVLYERYQKRLLVYFHRMLGNDEEKAQDFLQDILIKIVEKPHLFNAKSSFSAWAFTVAHNMVKNEYRRLSVREIISQEEDLDALLVASETGDLEQSIDDSEFKKILFDEISKLDSAKQSTFLLRFQEDFSIKEISAILDCSEGTVKSRLFYTCKYLAVKLKAYAPLS